MYIILDSKQMAKLKKDGCINIVLASGENLTIAYKHIENNHKHTKKYMLDVLEQHYGIEYVEKLNKARSAVIQYEFNKLTKNIK